MHSKFPRICAIVLLLLCATSYAIDYYPFTYITNIEGTNWSNVSQDDFWQESDGFTNLKSEYDQDVWLKSDFIANGSIGGTSANFAIGYKAVSTGLGTAAIGYLSEATGTLNTAVGVSCKSHATGIFQTCLGYGSFGTALTGTLLAGNNYALNRGNTMTVAWGGSNPTFIDLSNDNITIHSTTAGPDSITLQGDDIHIKGDITHYEEVKGTKVFLCGAGRNSATVGTEYLRDYNGRVQSNVRGCTMTGPGSITEIGANGLISIAVPNATVIFSIRKNGAAVFNCSIHADEGTGNKNCTTIQARGIDTFEEHDILSFYVAENLEVGGAIDIDYPDVMAWGYHDE